MKMTTLNEGLHLYHGTDVEIPTCSIRGPGWFCFGLASAQKWAGWAKTEGGGLRRVLVFRLVRPLVVIDTVTRSSWVDALRELGLHPDESGWQAAKVAKERGYAGWKGGNEVMICDPASCLHYLTTNPVPTTMKSYGEV